MLKIMYPNLCDAESVFRFCAEICKFEGAEKVLIDFSLMGRIEPFTIHGFWIPAIPAGMTEHGVQLKLVYKDERWRGSIVLRAE